MSTQASRVFLFPYSPTQEEWDALTSEQRRTYYASIPQDPDRSVTPPESLGHDLPLRRGREALEHFFRKRGRHIFLANNLRVLYPGEPAFDPDLLAVLDVDKSHDEELPAWVVAEERRGLDLVLEVHVRGDRAKDAVNNVERYARLGIPEYFLFDRPARRLFGWRLRHPGATTYQALIPQGGRLSSEVLDLELGLSLGRLRFFAGTAELPDSAELIDRLDAMVDRIEGTLEEEQRLREEEQRLREEEQRLREVEQRLREVEQHRREAAERRVAELEAELERLKSGR